MLGLLDNTDSGIRSITPDYDKPLEEVCMDATVQLIESEQCLDILVEDWGRCNNKPHWAIDFSNVRNEPHSLLQRERFSYSAGPQRQPSTLGCCASKAKTPILRFVGQQLIANGILSGTARIVACNDWESPNRFFIDPQELATTKQSTRATEDGIIEFSPKLTPASNETQELESCILNWLEELTGADTLGLKSDFAYANAVDLEEQFARTVTADRYIRTAQSGHIERHDFRHHAKEFKTYKASREFRIFASHTLRGRVFFVIHGGICGVGHPNTRVGDIVAILLGCSIPVLLRPCENGDTYTLIGECFVSGIMYGELMTLYEEGKMPMREFCLV